MQDGSAGQQESQSDEEVQAEQGSGDPDTAGSGNGSRQSGEEDEADEKKQAGEEPALPAVVAPVATAPIKTQLGGKRLPLLQVSKQFPASKTK